MRPPAPDLRLSTRPLPNPFDDEPESREMMAIDVVPARAPEPTAADSAEEAPPASFESGVEADGSAREQNTELDATPESLPDEALTSAADAMDVAAMDVAAMDAAAIGAGAMDAAAVQQDQVLDQPLQEAEEDLSEKDLHALEAETSLTEEAPSPEMEASFSQAVEPTAEADASPSAEPPALEEQAVSEAPSPTPKRQRSLSGFQAERPITVPPHSVSPQIARAVRGPIPQERAEALLAEATHRDEVLFVLLRYAQQFFDFVAIFSVTKDEARGRMAHGAGLSQELMEHLVIPLTEGGFAARVIRGQRPVVGDWGPSDEERAALALLGRPAGRPGLAVPITLGSRVALLVYADRHGEGLSVTDASPVVAIVPALGDALRRLILEQKTLRSALPRFLTTEGAEGSTPPAEAASISASEVGEGAASQAEDTPELSHAQHTDEASQQEPQAPDESEEPLENLAPVDLQAVSRLSFTERKRTLSESLQGVRSPAVSPEAREAARGRVPGVPRSAPPPPVRESLPPPAGVTPPSNPGNNGAGAYSYVAPMGAVAEESIRGGRQHGGSRAFSVREARESSAAAGAQPSEALEPTPAKAPEAAPSALAQAAPAKSAEKAPARPNRLSLVSQESVPSVIIDMGDQVNALVDALLRASPGDPLGEISELVKLGETVLPVLMQHFPGPLWIDLNQPPKHKLRGRDVSAVARCLIAFGDRAAPYVASKLSTNEPDLCRYALLVAGEIIHPDLLDPVARRTFDAHDGVRAVALDVLRNFTRMPQFDAVLRAICDLSARPGKDPRRQRIALDALAELRDMRTLRTLIARLVDPSEAIVAAAHKALVVLTGQDFGVAARRWEAWAEQVGGTHRVEWLIDALGHQDEALRALAGEEIKQLTQQYFGYHPALPKKDRDLAQRKYREWWEREGRGQFFVR